MGGLQGGRDPDRDRNCCCLQGGCGIGGGCSGGAGLNTTGGGCSRGAGLNTTGGGCCSLGFAKTPELGLHFDVGSSTFGFATTPELSFDFPRTPAELEELESSTAFAGTPELDMSELGLFLGCTPLGQRISSISWQKASDRNSSRNADSPCRTLSP